MMYLCQTCRIILDKTFGIQFPREIKSVKTVSSKLPDGPIKRKIEKTKGKSEHREEGTPSKKIKLSTPGPKVSAKKKITKTSTKEKKLSSSPSKKRKSSPSMKRAPSPKKRKSLPSKKRAPSPKKRKSSPSKKRAPSPKKRKLSPSKKRAPSPKKRKSSPSKKRAPSPKKNFTSSSKKKKIIKAKVKKSKKKPLKRKSKTMKKPKQLKTKKGKPSQRKGQITSKNKGQPKVTSQPSSKPKGSSFMPFACISKWWKGNRYDYASYKTYYGNEGPVTTYAQFIHANKAHSHGEIKPYFQGCSKIWRKLPEEQKAVFEKASHKDIERYHKTALYRSRVKKNKK